MDTFIVQAQPNSQRGIPAPPPPPIVEIDERARLPLAMKLILVSWFLPEGLSFFVAGLRLNVVRVLFLILTPVVFTRFANKVASGRYRFVASDAFVPAAAFWMFLGPCVLYGLSDSLAHSGPVVLEYLIAYMVTRVLLEENGQALAFLSMLCAVIACIVLDASLDTLTGRYFTRDLVSALTGFQKDWAAGAEDNFRFGLLRAAGPIEHPILFGLIAGVGLLIAVTVKIRFRTFCIAVCGLGTVICFSSAPEQGVLMGFGLLIYGRVMAGMRVKWLLIVGGLATIALTLFLASNAPFGLLFDIATIDPQTAYYRLYIWNLLGPYVLQSPWFGVFTENLEYQGSVDSLWLVLSLTYGIPCAIFVGLSLIGSCSLPTDPDRAYLGRSETQAGTVLGIIMAVIIFMGFTVHFWGSAWILVGLLTGLRAHLGERGALNRLELPAPFLGPELPGSGVPGPAGLPGRAGAA
jgi:hypothetical protein